MQNVKFNLSEIINELNKEWQEEYSRLTTVDIEKNDYKPEIEGHFSKEHFESYKASLNTLLPQTNILSQINNQIDADGIVVAAAGSLPGDLERLWQTKNFNSYHMEYGYSTMGYEIAGALGAKLAETDKEVYALVGDGSFLMLHTELITALQYDKKINIILFDNSGYGCINNLQMGNGSDSFCTELMTNKEEIMTIDYAKVAEGYGAKTYKVNSYDELNDALEASKNDTKSTLIDIKVLPKTMTDGYESFWHVGVSETSQKENVKKSREDLDSNLKHAKSY